MRTISFYLILFSGVVNGSASNAQRIDSVLNTMATRYPTEKLYIHFDKSSYIAGETIWFKSYFVSDGLPSGLSTDCFVQLVDDKGKIVDLKRYPVIGATAKGNIDLPDSLPQGNYTIRAGTPRMSEHGDEFIYIRNVFVYNPSIKNSDQSGSKPRALTVNFYPESGYLVDGILTVVAFKATDAGDRPVDINGLIRTGDGTTICSFRSFHDGIGKTQFKPIAGKKYFAEIEYDGKSNTYFLPEVQPSGVNLKVEDEKGGKLFLLSRGGKERNRFSSLTLVAHMDNRIIYETDIEFEDYPSVKGHIITDSLPSGIIHFTVFDKESNPLVERLSFVNNEERLSDVELTVSRSNFAIKGKNSIEFNFPEIIQRSLSVAITAESTSGTRNPENILTSLLLTGDLKGSIFNPSYYLGNNSDSVVQAFDNLMLTFGWSRFEWKKMLAGLFPPDITIPGPYLSISGMVKNESGKEPVSGGQLNIYLQSGDSSSQSLVVPVGKGGRFRMDSAIYYGEAKFYYVYLNPQGKKRVVKIELDRNGTNSEPSPLAGESHNYSTPAYFPEDADTKGRYEWIKESKHKVKELERVILQTRSTKKPVELVNEKYTTGVYRAMGKVNIDNINQPSNDKSGNVLNYIKNRIQQVELEGNQFVSRKNFSLGSGEKWTVGVVLDEHPVDASMLRSLRVDDIALVKYYEAGFVGAGSNSPGGLIAVYTRKKGDDADSPKSLEYFKSTGYSLVKKFYSPDYENTPGLNQFADKRSTLYWNPDIYTGVEPGPVKVDFFNNDNAKKFRVIMEGFDVKGKLVHLETWIEQ